MLAKIIEIAPAKYDWLDTDVNTPPLRAWRLCGR